MTDEQPLEPRPNYPRCGAVVETVNGRKGEPCMSRAGWGTDHKGEGHCRWHDKSDVTSRRRSDAHVLTQRQGWAAKKMYGDRSDKQPHEALLEQVQWSIGHVAWLQERIAQIETGDKLFTRQGTVLLNRYADERKHLAAVAKMAIDAGLMERMVKLQEREGEMLGQIAVAAVDALGLGDDVRKRLLLEMGRGLHSHGAMIDVRTIGDRTVPVHERTVNVVMRCVAAALNLFVSQTVRDNVLRDVARRLPQSSAAAADGGEVTKPPPVTPETLARWGSDSDHTEPDDVTAASWWQETMQVPVRAQVVN